MLKTYLPESITLPDGTELYPVIGGHVKQQMFYTAPTSISALIAEARRRKLKYRRVEVLHRNLRGKLDLHGQPYRSTKWVFVEVPKQIPADFPVKELKPGDKAEDRATCGTCGRSWDDAVITSYTPAPSARCPFEYFH